MPSPLISVILPVYNGEQFVLQAIQSLQQQTFQDFELLIINDGSSDRTMEICSCAAKSDRRIHVLHQGNQGLVNTLNRGLKIAKGRYIARMDADDISLPNRLETQVAHMEQHTEVGVCGTWLETFGGARRSVIEYPTSHDDLRSALLFYSPLAHPSVMMRTETFHKHSLLYDKAYQHTEDYDLWERASHHMALANVGRVLLRYRVHKNQVVQRHEALILRNAERIRRRQLEAIGIQATTDEMDVHNYLAGAAGVAVSRAFILRAHEWMVRISSANSATSQYSKESLQSLIAVKWFSICYAAPHLGTDTLRLFWSSPFARYASVSTGKRFFLAIRCLIRWKPQ